MEQTVRNKLRNVVTQCRKLLEESISQQLQGQFGIYAGKKDAVQIEDEARMGHLSDDDRQYRRDLLDHFEHIKARGFKPKDALDQLIREIAFTHLNRLCAYKMMEARDVYVCGQKFREAVSRGIDSNRFKFYLADHADDERLFSTGQQEVAYRHFLDWLGGLLSEEIGVLFNPNDPANRLYPRQKTLDDLLDLLNGADIKAEETELREAWPKIWEQDETIGWVYQYFTPKELRDQARKESQAPRNSYELAFRNQFFTPRYVVEFLTDNTLGRIWYEMRQGKTSLKDQCRYMVRRPNEVFMGPQMNTDQHGSEEPDDSSRSSEIRVHPCSSVADSPNAELSQEELLKRPVYIPYRPKKDPRQLKILDPACGSGHFLLYCFDLLLTIYEEAYADEDLGPALKEAYPTLDELRRAVPGLIVSRNLHGIDIDLRATQIAALALWLRSQRAYQEMGITKDRPKITRSNIVCAEPMPGEEKLLDEFLKTLREDRLERLIRRVMNVPNDKPVRTTEEMADRLCDLVRLVWDKMKLAGEAGSLLKIEEELQDAIRKGQEEWEEKQPLFRISQYSLTEEPQEEYVRFVPEEGLSFWERAEALVMAALDDFAVYASNGRRLLRRLFADDAIRGFAFVDLCRQRFDAVLMNPPFGEVSVPSRSYLYSTYENAAQDVFSAFVDRGLNMLVADGFVGAITSRLAFFLELLEPWRERILGKVGTLLTMADLGYGVLDDALVEAAAYAIRRTARTSGTRSIFINLLSAEDKAAMLGPACRLESERQTVFVVNPSSFLEVPSGRAAYWVSDHWRRLFGTESNIQACFGFPFVGLQTGNDELFLRLHWEVPEAELEGPHPRWVTFAKGGEYAPFYGDYHLVLDWSIHDDARRQSNADAYFKPGVTYTERTTSNLSARVLPAGCVFSPNGVTISSPPHRLMHCVFLLNTRATQFLLETCVGSGDAVHSGSAARHYGPRIIARIPVPQLSDEDWQAIQCGTEAVWREMREFASAHEPDRFFATPFILAAVGTSVREMAHRERTAWEQKVLSILRTTAIGENILHHAFGINDAAFAEMERELGPHPDDLPDRPLPDEDQRFMREEFLTPIESLIDRHVEQSGASRFLTKKAYIADRRIELLSVRHGVHPKRVVQYRQDKRLLHSDEVRGLAERIISYFVGVVFGRWDLRMSLDEAKVPVYPDILAPLPPNHPGMLRIGGVTDVLPVCPDYDGVLVDDPENADDIVQNVRKCFECVWKDIGDALERDVSECLGMKDLREYFRRPTKNGMWDDHVRRYSKSRRKAPIYWLLQSSKRNYALWLYYHRLDKDMLFKALVNYVEPKIQREENRLAEFRSQKSSAGESGKGAKKLDRDIEKQEDLLSELRDFEEKLRGAAKLHLEPDLNDGVILNIAPLWELVPWKEAKKYWQELLDGKYEWSSIGKQLREKGLVK